jgi:hypothetical protein
MDDAGAQLYVHKTILLISFSIFVWRNGQLKIRFGYKTLYF